MNYIHSNGYVHQDVKPANILLTSEGKALIGDFGVGHSFMSFDQVIGTPAYQAPESIPDEIYSESSIDDFSDHIDDQSFDSKGISQETLIPEYQREPEKEDVWALGVTLYQLLFGKLPYIGDNIYEIVLLAKEEKLQIPSGTNPLIEELIRGMLQIDPSQRFSISKILNHPLIASAPDKFSTTTELLASTSSTEPSNEKYEDILSSQINKIQANVCGNSFSFAIRRNRRNSDIAPPLSPITKGYNSFHPSKLPDRPSSIPNTPPL